MNTEELEYPANANEAWAIMVEAAYEQDSDEPERPPLTRKQQAFWEEMTKDD